MDRNASLDVLKRMLRIRLFEERTMPLVENGEIACPVHLYVGQEGIAAGVCAALRDTDYAYSTHRSHGHYIAKGGDIGALMAELLGRDAGCSRGHGGSMHVVDRNVGFMGSSAIVGGTIPIAVGAALSIARQMRDDVAVAFFGDGATDEGVFYESINFAAVMKLPVLFVCENNMFSTHMPDYLRQSNPNVSERIAGFGVTTARVDGNDALAVHAAAAEMVGRARAHYQPYFIEALTFRWLAHVGITADEDIGYRRKSDIDRWKARCPIQRLRCSMEREALLAEGEFEEIREQVIAAVERAVEFAHQSRSPGTDSFRIGMPSAKAPS